MRGVVVFLFAAMALQSEGSGNTMDLLKSEGQEGWMSKLMGKERRLNLGEELSRNTRNADDPYTLEKMTPKLQAVEQAITKDFQPDAAKRPKRWFSKFKENWNSEPYTERQARSIALISASINIPRLANAKDDPVGAVQGLLNIMASVSQVAGPTGQLVSVGFMFVSSLLGLFGLGKKPKPIGDIVREQINQALSEFHDQLISDKVGAAVFAFRISKAYVDGAGKTREKIDDNDVGPLITNVPVLSGVEVMGLLATQIDNLRTENKPSNHKKCFKYVELYCKLATLKFTIMSQVISLIPETFPATIDGYANVVEVLRRATGTLMEFLHNPNLSSKLMPYFDGESYPFANEYMKITLKIPRPNHFPGSGYCISASAKGRNYLSKYQLPKFDHPITKILGSADCKWKLLPHGNNLYSITSKDGGMLSYYQGSFPYVSLLKDAPALWEFQSLGGSSYRITFKYLCASKCDYWLNVRKNEMTIMVGAPRWPLHLSAMSASFHEPSNETIPWIIYKGGSSDATPTEQVYDANQNNTPVDENGVSRNVSENELKRIPELVKSKNQSPEEQEDSSPDNDEQEGKENIKILTTEGGKEWLKKLLQTAKKKLSEKQGSQSTNQDEMKKKTKEKNLVKSKSQKGA